MKKLPLFFIFTFIFFLSSCDTAIDDATSTDKFSDLGSATPPAGGNGQVEAGQITAGEWNDLDHWDFWKDLLTKGNFSQYPDYWKFNLKNRVSVVVKNKSGKVLQNVSVKLLNKNNSILWEAQTDNFGKAELWVNQKSLDQTNESELKLNVKQKVIVNPVLFENGINQIEIDEAFAETRKIDIAFVVDATGSMGDELEYLKVEVVDVINKVKAKNSSATLNIGAVFYRDEGDDYVTRSSNFSTNISQTIEFIKNQRADGGGDFPEAVHTALEQSINGLQWSSSGSKILFLVLDAPPHYDEKIISKIHELMGEAAKKGIKVIPVTASGIDKETELLMRYMGMVTNGTYVFITNHSGIGNEHLEATVGEYQVEYLNKLLERLLNKYLE